MITGFQQPETWLVAAPALGGAMAFALGAAYRRTLVTIVTVIVLLSLYATGQRLLEIGVYNHAIGGWVAPLGISWRIDGLTVVMLGLSVLVGVGINGYSLSYFGRSAQERHQALFFWPLWLMLWSALHALFLARDLFNWYVTLELVGLGAVALITLSAKPAALAGGMRYLVLALSASLFYLLGVALLYGEYGALDLDSLAAHITRTPVTMAALAAITVGLIVKAALFPMHFWLPPAHANAPSPVSALLSALVVKCGFYILLRLITDLWPREMTAGLMQGLGVLGGAAVLWGSFHAIRQTRLKRLVAYSTVAQLGYLFMMFPLMKLGWDAGNDWASRAWAGGIYQAISHGLAKASLFLAAGVLIHARGSDALAGLRGLGERLPITITAMSLAALSLMGIPPGAGFIAKWMMLTVAVTAGAWIWAGILVTGGLMAVGYLFRIFRRVIQPCDGPDVYHPPRRALEWAALYLAILSVVFGISSLPVLDLLRIGAPEGLSLYFGGPLP